MFFLNVLPLVKALPFHCSIHFHFLSNIFFFLSPASCKQKPQLSQDDITGMVDPLIHSPFTFTSTSTIKTNHLTTSPASDQLFVPGSKSSLLRWIVWLCRINRLALTREGWAFSGHGHHSVTWLQGSVHPLFKKHFMQHFAGWLPLLLCWGPTQALSKYQCADLLAD